MKDIPVFTTEYGIASLILNQIPYRKTAYIQVQTAQDGKLEDVVADCAGFCRVVGADTVFWTAQDDTHQPHSHILELRGQAVYDPQKVESLFPVTAQTVGQWRQIHNARMEKVDHARFLTAADEAEILKSFAYFIHKDGNLLGIGWIADDVILALAAVQPGAGERVLHTLLSLVPDQSLRLEVASTNEKALNLYRRNGFVLTKIVKSWIQC